MQMLEFSVRKQKIYCESERGVIEKSQGLVYASFEFDNEWDGCSIAVIFSNENFCGNSRVVIWTGEPVLIPKELLVQGRLKVSCEGKREGYSIPTYEMVPGIMVYASGELVGVVPDDIEPSMVEQLMAAAAEARSAAADVLAAKEAGEFKGDRGDPGVTMEYDEQSKMLVIDYSEGNDGDQTGNETGTGTPGVGIASVIQTTTSTEDGGVNVITVTKTDGSTSTFQVRNGSQGGIGVGISNIGLANGVLTFSLTDGSQKTVNMPETESCGDCYNKEEIKAMFGSYIDDVAALVGGDA